MATVRMTLQRHPDVRNVDPLFFRFFLTAPRCAGTRTDDFFSLDVQTDLRKQFQEIARRHSPEPRQVYIFMTTAIVRNILLILIVCFFPLFWRGSLCLY